MKNYKKIEYLNSRKSNRLELYNYNSVGYYYVTICSKNHINYFGTIQNNNIILSQEGEIVKDCWLTIPNIYAGIDLDYFIIMPNHMHGIIYIDEVNIKNNHSRQTERLSKIIQGFKSASTKKIRKINFGFAWQVSFYDHVIRNETSLNKIREYIVNNPIKLEVDY